MSEAKEAAATALVQLLTRLEQKVDRLIAQTAPKQPGDDEQIYKDPKEKYWQGESYAGCKLSEAPADYLRSLAKYKSACAWANRKEGDPAKAKYAEKDDATAKLAAAWAEYREASGVTTPGRSAPKAAAKQEEFAGGAVDDSDIPF